MSSFANSMHSLVSFGSRLFPHDPTPSSGDNTDQNSKEGDEPQAKLTDFFHHNPDSWKVLWEFRSFDVLRREECFQSTLSLLLSWYHGFGSPKEAIMLQNPEELVDFSHWGDTGMFYLIHEQTPDLLRLQCTAPMRDVRAWCSQLLGELQSRGLPIPRPIYDSPSLFIQWSELSHLHGYTDDSSSIVAALFMEHFAKYCRLENYLMLMAFHVEYLETYLKFYHTVISGDCALPFTEIHYICILAAAQHRCAYLVRLHVMLFLLHGGKSSWLDTPTESPKRIQKLREINRILAHKPWLISSSHIESLTGAVSGSHDSTFSLSELMHAITLLCHIHSLCTFVFGCGITPELDSPLGHTTAPMPRESKTRAASEANGTRSGVVGCNKSNDSILEANEVADTLEKTERIEFFLEALEEVRQNENQEYREDDVVRRFQALLEDNRKLFHNLSNNNASMGNCEKKNNSPPHSSLEAPLNTALVEKFLADREYCYTSPNHIAAGKTHFSSDMDGAAPSEPENNTGDDNSADSVEIFRTLDFNWEDDGVTVADNCIPNMGFQFSERFTSIYDLTYCAIWGQYNVKTESYRRAIWNYIHSLYLIRHDDYNYSGIETLLTSSVRHYLLRLTVAPHTVTQTHQEMEDMQLFTPPEKVHLNLLAMDARLQASLLYALRAIKQSRV